MKWLLFDLLLLLQVGYVPALVVKDAKAAGITRRLLSHRTLNVKHEHEHARDKAPGDLSYGGGSPIDVRGFVGALEGREGMVRALGSKAGYGRGGEQESTFEADTGANNYFGWATGGMGDKFRFIDDMAPEAPMDRTGVADKVTVLGRRGAAGVQGAGLNVPPYLYPDAFPVVQGPSCNCSMSTGAPGLSPGPGPAPVAVPTTVSFHLDQHLDQDQAAISFAVAASAAPAASPSAAPGAPPAVAPAAAGPRLICKCEESDTPEAFRWTKITPIYDPKGGSAYTLTPADLTYPFGDYWHPHLAYGVVAPEDRLPVHNYPNQAPADQISSLPVFAREDRISFKFAKYMDQVEERASECDHKSPECTSDCVVGDNVSLAIGNLALPATVSTVHSGNSLGLNIVPAIALANPGGPKCALDAGCTAYRPCFVEASSQCTEVKDTSYNDWQGTLVTTSACPEGSKPCSEIELLVKGDMAKKEGKYCKAALPPAPR